MYLALKKGLFQNRSLRVMMKQPPFGSCYFTPKLKPVYNFSINFEFLDFTFSVSTKGKRLFRCRCYLAVLRQPLYVDSLICIVA